MAFRTEMAELLKRLLIFDEILNVINWNLPVRTLYETNGNLLLTLDDDDQEIRFKDSKTYKKNLIAWLLDLSP